MPGGKIKQKAHDLGFTVTGIAGVTTIGEEWELLNQWIEKGYHSGMRYMENYLQVRRDPALFLENAKSVIVVLLNYYTDEKPDALSRYRFSKYAFGFDYHDVMRYKLRQLSTYITSFYPGASVRLFTDTAPVMEKVWAQKSGAGWIGKNTCLVTQKNGSFFFIGGLVTDIDLPVDPPAADHCGNCRKCLDACPTGALIEPYVLDAGKCISYLTIEHKDELPSNNLLRSQEFIFGCDICQDVCPWNKFSNRHEVPEFNMSDAFRSLTKEKLENLGRDEFSVIFKKSAVKRCGFNGLVRNIKAINDDDNKKG